MPGMSDENGGRADAGVQAQADQFTGSFIVLLDTDDLDAGVSALRDGAGVTAAEPADGQDIAEVLATGGTAVLPEIGVAVVTVAPDQRAPLLAAAAEAPRVLAVEPERMMYALDDAISVDYLRGFRDAIDSLIAREAANGGAGSAAVQARVWDESRATWGLQAIRVPESCLTGRGIRVAVLDTGVDATHRDLAGRVITTMSFIQGQTAVDGHGHGTHCIGTACGARQPAVLPRYGVAADAEIFAGKVLSNAGSGSDGGILAGIDWAVGQGCRVISMSLGAPTNVGDAFSTIYETVAQRALQRGTIIVAAAGNDSRRPSPPRPVSRPANCPSILAVAALTPDIGVASFSNAGLNPNGGQIDIAAPGVSVRSAAPEPVGYRSMSGTSMATPHVAGVIALLAEGNPAASPADLKNLLLAGAQRLPLSSSDVGAGLVQAP